MTSSEGDKTLGEIARSVDRIEDTLVRITTQMQVAIAPITAHAVLIDTQQKIIDRIQGHLEATDARVEAAHIKAAWISGVIAAGATAINFILGRH